MHRGKAAGLDGLTVQHLQCSHPLLPRWFSRIFQPYDNAGSRCKSFGNSYTVPILNSGCNIHGKSATVDDFRGTSISPVLSKVLEQCILDRYNSIFAASDNQYGFFKQSGCSRAVCLLRCVTDYYVSSGSTVNVYALDLSKVFDKMNHYRLFVKLMERQIPENLLLRLERCFSICRSSVKWWNAWSSWFTLRCVLSPCLFAIYGLVKKVQSCGYGCYVHHTCVGKLLYADDILLLAPSVSALQLLLSVCEKELQWLDVSINSKKISMFAYWPTIQR